MYKFIDKHLVTNQKNCIEEQSILVGIGKGQELVVEAGGEGVEDPLIVHHLPLLH